MLVITIFWVDFGGQAALIPSPPCRPSRHTWARPTRPRSPRSEFMARFIPWIHGDLDENIHKNIIYGTIPIYTLGKSW
jgi:hypothetical protein